MSRLILVPGGMWRRLALFAASFALLFTLVAGAEYLFARNEFESDVADGLRQTTDEVVQLLNDNGRWNLAEYRQADIPVTQYFIISKDGLLIDVQGFAPGFIAAAVPVDTAIYGHPKSVKTEVDETWLLEGRKVSGGSVIAGIQQASFMKDPDKVLQTELAKFGGTLDKAARVKAGNISNYINAFVVLDDFGEIKSALSGIPLRMKLNVPRNLRDDIVYPFRVAGTDYAILSHSVHLKAQPTESAIVAFDDIGDRARVLGLYRRFNLIVGAASWTIAVIGVAALLIGGEIKRRRQEVSLEDALRAGEGPTIEFKAGFIDKSFAHTMAAFANTDSGNIFLGVNDNAEVVGLHDAETPKARDNWLQRIGGLARDVIQPPPLVYSKFITYQDKIVLRIFVPRGPAVAYMVQRVALIRHMASVREAGPDDLQIILKSHRRYWG